MVGRASLRTIIKKYNVFLVDIYGVLRHASGVYKNAHRNLKEIEDQGKRIIFFSNTCNKLPDGIAQKLKDEGFDAREEQVITSGMALSIVFPQMNLVGKPIISVGNDAADKYIKRAGGRICSDLREAKASVLGYFLTKENVRLFDMAIELATKRGKPTILANTDRYIPINEHKIDFGPGIIGEIFEERSGLAPIKIGKPFSYMYQLAYKKLKGVPKSDILAIGDSIDHDIQGAVNEGIDSLLVLSGLQGIITPGTKLDAYMKEKGIYPTYILPSFAF